MAEKPTPALPGVTSPRQQHDVEANFSDNDNDNDDTLIKRQRLSSTFTQLWNESVDLQYTDLVCLVLCLVTGLCDSSAYNAWSCFLGMQTGMTTTYPPISRNAER